MTCLSKRKLPPFSEAQQLPSLGERMKVSKRGRQRAGGKSEKGRHIEREREREKNAHFFPFVLQKAKRKGLDTLSVPALYDL